MKKIKAFLNRVSPIRGRRGIALVVVLGMLALLVMMGVAFSIFMRTERQAAGSFVHDVRARQLLFAARGRAMEALENNLRGKPYPDWIGMVSPGTGITLTTNDLWAKHVPDNLLLDAQFPKQAGWITVNNGRVGYLIINASGLLDPNHTGGATRGPGVSPREIDVGGLPEVTDPAKLKNNRPYESIAELKRAGTADGLSGVSHLVDFSYCTNDIPADVVDVSGNDTQLKTRKAKIVTKLNQKFPDINANMVFDALVDYVDENSVPTSLDSPCTERVPMINEVRVTPITFADPDPAKNGVNVMFRVELELFYPFVSPNPGKYRVKFKYTINAPCFAGPVQFEDKADEPVELEFNSEPYSILPISRGDIATFVACTAPGDYDADVTIDSITVLNGSGQTVDRIENIPLSMAGTIPKITIPAAPMDVETMVPGGMQCIDPRFNYLATFWVPFLDTDSIGTMGDVNDSIQWLFGKDDVFTDGHTWMHVADQSLQTPAELSYIIRGAEAPDPFNAGWRTLRLMDEDGGLADPIYDSFVVGSVATNKQGFLNANSDVDEALAAAMRGMLLDRYPGDAEYINQMKVTDAQALQLAAAWKTDAGSYYSRQSMVSNESYITRVKQIADSMIPAIPISAPAREFRYEAGIRNLLGLMNARQNYFIIILFAQSSARVQLPRGSSTPGVMIDTVRADQTALMEVWRDPVPLRTYTNAATLAESPIHPMILRRFEILAQE